MIGHVAALVGLADPLRPQGRDQRRGCRSGNEDACAVPHPDIGSNLDRPPSCVRRGQRMGSARGDAVVVRPLRCTIQPMLPHLPNNRLDDSLGSGVNLYFLRSIISYSFRFRRPSSGGGSMPRAGGAKRARPDAIGAAVHSVLVPDTAAYGRARTLAAQPRATVPVRRMRLRHRPQDQAETVA